MSKSRSLPVQNRIVGHGNEPTDQILANPRNWRIHPREQQDGLDAILDRVGWVQSVVINRRTGFLVDGHLRVSLAMRRGEPTVPVAYVDLSESEEALILATLDPLAGLATTDQEKIRELLEEVPRDAEVNALLDAIGFDLSSTTPPSEHGDPDELPAASAEPVTRMGDIWALGKHRVMCGDSTCPTDVEKLMAGDKATLLHADPPYGMSKEADGVQNDNLHGEDLDRFQMDWWLTFRPHLEDNASAYIWGNTLELWRLCFAAGLGGSEQIQFRNEIVWDKKSSPGMSWDGATQYMTATERCLFFQLGQQFVQNLNADDFPEEYEPIRSYLDGEVQAAGVKSADVKRLCGVGMFGHWFSRSQFTLIPREHYDTLSEAFPGHFLRTWSELKGEWDRVRGTGRDAIRAMLEGMRSYFDNGHDIMRDVWDFPRVMGDERHGHATPKPVAMMERVMKSSLPPGGLCVEPFGGSGSTLMAAETTGRTCYTMELTPSYVDVIVRRWEKYTGQRAELLTQEERTTA